jgi:hypothetical protein
MKTGNFLETLTAFDAIHSRRMQRGIMVWPRKFEFLFFQMKGLGKFKEF